MHRAGLTRTDPVLRTGVSGVLGRPGHPTPRARRREARARLETRALAENGETGSDPLAQYHPPVGAPGLLLIPAAAALLRGGPGAVDAQLDTC